MIDIHSHIIFGVDDGPSTIEQSLNMVKAAARLGITTIVATPHYQESIYELDMVEENYNELIKKAKEYGIIINLGYEVFTDPISPVIIKNRKKVNMNKSGIILFEFPFNADPKKCVDVVSDFDLQRKTPVIAHLERNRVFLNRFDCFVNLVKAGCYIQIDAASVIGVYGSKVKDFSRKLIQMNLVDVVASNAHCSIDYMEWYIQAYNKVSNWVGSEKASELFHDNAKGILETRSISGYSYQNVIRWERTI